jgi:hypothetical protein
MIFVVSFGELRSAVHVTEIFIKLLYSYVTYECTHDCFNYLIFPFIGLYQAFWRIDIPVELYSEKPGKFRFIYQSGWNFSLF